MEKICLMMVAGERSGDIYGAELATALGERSGSIEIFGCGGEAMRRAGVETSVDAHQFAMVGITEVISGLPQARRAFRKLVDEMERRRPRLAVLIDSPSLNLRLAKKIRRRGVPVVYFVSPQIWAWKKWRIHHLKTRVNKMLCLFEFEMEIYRKAGIPAECVGHPLVDLVRPHLTREEFFARMGLDAKNCTVALLPGSREVEVAFNLSTMLDCASRLALDRSIQFVIAAAPSLDPGWLESKTAQCYVGRAPLRMTAHMTHDALKHSDLVITASGTATLETALLERPMIVVYRVSPITWLLGKFMVHVPFYSMVNILAGRAIVPELIQNAFTAGALTARAGFLLDHPEALKAMVLELQALRPRLGPGGAIHRAAETIYQMLEAVQAAPASI